MASLEARKIKVMEVEEEVMELLLLDDLLLVVLRDQGQHMGRLLQKIQILVMVLPDLSGLHKGH